MITKASGLDKQEVYQMWKTIFADDDNGYTDFYFKTYYRNEDTFVKKIGEEVVGCCSKHPHTIMLHDRLLRCSMIVGMAVKPTYRKRGIMHEMMKSIMDEIDHQELITMIQAYQPSLYEPFGFEKVYSRRYWTIHRQEVKKVKPEISTLMFPKDCLKLYAEFVSRFNGFVVRDIAYFDSMLKEIEAENGKMIAYYNDRKIEGYATLYLENGKVVLRECLYLTSTALLHMVNYALGLRPEILLHASSAENLSKLFPYSSYEEVGYTMVRLNNKELFNRLYNCNVNNAKEAMNLIDKPLYMHENR